VTKGTKEPYRMFTSRAEYRLLLREDNADLRLTPYGYKIGLIDEQTHERVVKKQIQMKEGLAYLEETTLTPSNENNAFLASIGEDKITDKVTLQKIVARSDFTVEKLEKLAPIVSAFSEEAKEQILIEAKYKNYIEKQKEQIDTMKEMIDVKIPPMMDFSTISGLSNEVVEKLQRFNPPTLFAASEISGITPAALDILHVYIKIFNKK
jgi:tRNA uridine 5-carboxymethylaminomethyl modification enzyme